MPRDCLVIAPRWPRDCHGWSLLGTDGHWLLLGHTRSIFCGGSTPACKRSPRRPYPLPLPLPTGAPLSGGGALHVDAAPDAQSGVLSAHLLPHHPHHPDQRVRHLLSSGCGHPTARLARPRLLLHVAALLHSGSRGPLRAPSGESCGRAAAVHRIRLRHLLCRRQHLSLHRPRHIRGGEEGRNLRRSRGGLPRRHAPSVSSDPRVLPPVERPWPGSEPPDTQARRLVELQLQTIRDRAREQPRRQA